jgi:hypothetical protein
VQRSERLRLKQAGHLQAGHLEEGEERHDEVEPGRHGLEELVEPEPAPGRQQIGDLADAVTEADAIGDDVVRELHLAPVEYALERLDQREYRHLGQRRQALRLPLLDRHPPAEDVSPGDAPRGELFAGVLVLLVLEQPADERLPRVSLVLDVRLVLLTGGRSRQQQLRLDVGKRGRHHEVLGGNVELHQLHDREILQVFLGQEANGDVEDVQLVLLAKVQQQIERSLELRELHRPCRCASVAGLAIGHD